MHSRTLKRSALAGIAIVLAAGCQQVPQGANSAPETRLPSAAASAPGATARPSNAGRISIRQWPEFTVDNKALRAAPGARILSSGNLMMTPNMVPDGARVQYELDGAGQVKLIRVLDAGTAPAPR